MSQPPPLPPEPPPEPGSPFPSWYTPENQASGGPQGGHNHAGQYGVPYGSPSADSKNMAMLAHLLGILGFIGPLVIWLVKKNDDPFVDQEAKEALNFQLSMIVFSLICVITFVGIFLLPVISILDIVLCISAAMKAKEGITYQYPFCIRFIS